jgi:hypothetical protein
MTISMPRPLRTTSRSVTATRSSAGRAPRSTPPRANDRSRARRGSLSPASASRRRSRTKARSRRHGARRRSRTPTTPRAMRSRRRHSTSDTSPRVVTAGLPSERSEGRPPPSSAALIRPRVNSCRARPAPARNGPKSGRNCRGRRQRARVLDAERAEGIEEVDPARRAAPLAGGGDACEPRLVAATRQGAFDRCCRKSCHRCSSSSELWAERRCRAHDRWPRTS